MRALPARHCVGDGQRLVVVNGHPDPRRHRYCAALTAAYVRGGAMGGWSVRSVNVGDLTATAMQGVSCGDPPDASAAEMLALIAGADRLAIIFPLLFDRPPEPLRALFALAAPRKAHLVVTMNMPAFAYRSMLRQTEAPAMMAIPNIIADHPVLIGCVSSLSAIQRQEWLQTMSRFGEQSLPGRAIIPSGTALTRIFDRVAARFLA